MEGDCTSVRSAWDIDGDLVVVGMGPISEPSSVLLLLVGGVMLALRRRRFG